MGLWLAALFFLLTFPLPASAQTFPKFTGLVVDAANVIPDDREAALAASLQALQKDTGRQLVVATIPDLAGDAIEDYGYRLGRAWGVGLKGLNNGAILIVAPNDRKVRVEVGYGLTPVLTDALSSVIVTTRILPHFRDGDIPGGIADGAAALVAQLRLPDAEAQAKVMAAVEQQRAAAADDGGGWIIIIVFILAIVIVLFLTRRFSGAKGRRFRGGRAPVVIWGPGLGGGWSSGGSSGSSSGGGWLGGGFSGGGGGLFGGGGASGSW